MLMVIETKFFEDSTISMMKTYDLFLAWSRILHRFRTIEVPAMHPD